MIEKMQNEKTRETRLSEAFVALADTLTAEYDIVDLLSTLVEACTDVLDVNAGGLMLADATGTLQLVASTSEEADLVEIMQLNAGSGPCVECFATGAAVAISDIDETGERWPEFRAAAGLQGFRSVNAVPLTLRGQTIGTMNLFGKDLGKLTAEDEAAAQALADVATIGILQERLIREAGVVSEQLQRALDSRVLIEQAKGVLAQSADLEMGAAFAALRTYARNNNISLRSVAEEVVDRTLDLSAITSPAAAQAETV